MTRSSSPFVSAVFWNSVLMAVSLPMAIGTAVLIGRWLGPAGKGEYTLATVVEGLLAVFLSLGIPSAISYFLASGRAPAASLTKTATLLAAALGAAAFAAAFLIDRAGRTSHLIGIPRLSPVVWVALLALPFHLVGTFLQFVNLALGQRVLFAVLPAAGQLLSSLLVVALLLRGSLTAFSAVAALTLSHVSAAAFLLSRAQLQLDWWRAPLLPLSLCRRLVTYSALSYTAETLQFLVRRLDVFLLSAFLDLRAVGWYSVASGAAELLLLLPGRFGNLFQTRVAARQRQPSAPEEVSLSSSMVLLGTLLAAVILAALAPFGIRLLYGPAFAPAAAPLVLLLPGICASAVALVHAAYLSGVGRLRTNALASSVSLVVNVLLNLVLIPRYGILGAAVASSLAYSLQAIWLVRAVARLTGIPLLNMLTAAALPKSGYLRLRRKATEPRA